jgi:hypothetical protein
MADKNSSHQLKGERDIIRKRRKFCINTCTKFRERERQIHKKKKIK